jgi:hypothetical protein
MYDYALLPIQAMKTYEGQFQLGVARALNSFDSSTDSAQKSIGPLFGGIKA